MAARREAIVVDVSVASAMPGGAVLDEDVSPAGGRATSAERPDVLTSAAGASDGSAWNEEGREGRALPSEVLVMDVEGRPAQSDRVRQSKRLSIGARVVQQPFPL